MWHKKKRNVDLFNHELVTDMDIKVSEYLDVPIAKVDKKIIESLSKKEVEISEIKIADLLSIIRDFNDELYKFICLVYSAESTIEKSGEKVIRSNGLSPGFSITYTIYFFFLKKDMSSALGSYLAKRIPNSHKFHDRLTSYFAQLEFETF